MTLPAHLQDDAALMRIEEFVAGHKQGLKRFVTVRDLINSGLVSVDIDGTRYATASGAPTLRFYGAAVNAAGAEPAPAPSGLTATGGPGWIDLAWDAPTGAQYAHTQIYRSAAANGTPLPIARTRGARYRDPVATGATFYYWIRHATIAPYSLLSDLFPAGDGIGAQATRITLADIAGQFPAAAVDNAALARGDLINIGATKVANAAFGRAQFGTAVFNNAHIDDLAVTDLNIIKAGTGRLVIQEGDFEELAVKSAHIGGTVIDDLSVERGQATSLKVQSAHIDTFNQVAGTGGLGGAKVADLNVSTIKIKGGALTLVSSAKQTTPAYLEINATKVLELPFAPIRPNDAVLLQQVGAGPGDLPGQLIGEILAFASVTISWGPSLLFTTQQFDLVMQVRVKEIGATLPDFVMVASANARLVEISPGPPKVFDMIPQTVTMVRSLGGFPSMTGGGETGFRTHTGLQYFANDDGFVATDGGVKTSLSPPMTRRVCRDLQSDRSYMAELHCFLSRFSGVSDGTDPNPGTVYVKEEFRSQNSSAQFFRIENAGLTLIQCPGKISWS